MADSYLSQFNMQYYKGAENVSVLTGQPDQIVYLDELSNSSSNNIYLLEDELDDYNYYISAIDSGNLYLDDNMAGIFSGLTNLRNTDVLNKDIINYHYVRNMHTGFANCFSLTGTPISAKRVLSMYGTYYNCQNMSGIPQVNSNVNNLIGTYYNCINISQGNSNKNVKVMIDTFANCANLTGVPKIGDNVISIYNAYYNCYGLSGAPSNCNNALITVNAYYNVPHLSGTFYWYVRNYALAEIVNAQNMFYNRDCSVWLNIYVRPNKCIFNALVNYSAEFGNIYGVGAIDWTEGSSGLYGYHNYENQLYKTRIVPYLRPINLSSYTFKNSFSNNDRYESYSRHTYYYYNWGFNIWIGVFNNLDDANTALPSRDTSSFLGISTDTSLNSSYGINVMKARYRYYHRNDGYEGSSYTYYYNFWVNYYFISLNDKYPEDCFWNASSSYYFPHMDQVNTFDYISYFNIDRAKTMNYSYHGRTFQNNQTIYAICGDNVINMIYTYHNFANLNVETNRDMPMDSYAFRLLTNNDPIYGGGNIYHCLPEEYWKVYDNNYTKMYDNSYGYPMNISIVPICGPNVELMDHTYTNWRLEGKPKIGSKVTNAYYTYNGCRNVPTAVCGSAVENLIGTYYNSDVETPKINKETVLNAYRAYGYTNVNSETIVLPKNLLHANFTYRNCGKIFDIENISFVNQYDLKGCFLGCSNLRVEADSELNFKNNNQIKISYMFFNCYNMNYIIPFKSDYTILNNMDYTYFRCNLQNLRDKHFFCNNLFATFAYTNITTGADMLFFPETDRLKIDYIFAYCYHLTDNIDWNFVNINMDTVDLYGCFRHCANIQYTNLEFNQARHNHVILNSGVFLNCHNMITINFSNLNNNMVECNYDGLFWNCTNLTRFIGIDNFNGYVATVPYAHGSTSAEINKDSDSLENNIFSLYSGQGGHSFENCYNLEYMPNFISGGIFGPNSFGNCYKIHDFNFLRGDGATATYSFIGSAGYTSTMFFHCDNLQQIYFQNVLPDINTNYCGHLFRECINLQRVYVESDYYTRIRFNFTESTVLAHSCPNLPYVFEVNVANCNYYISEESSIEYPHFMPVTFNFNHTRRASAISSSILEDELTLIRDCGEMLDMTNCNYGILYNSNFRYVEDIYKDRNFYSMNYTGNLVELVINSNYTPYPILNNSNLLKLEYLTIRINECDGWFNKGQASVGGEKLGASQQLYVKVFNNTYISSTQTVLNRCILEVKSRWMGLYWNESNYNISRNVSISRNFWHASNIFDYTQYTKINLFMMDDRAYKNNIYYVGYGDEDTTNGVRIYSKQPLAKNHFFNMLLNYSFGPVTNINLFVMQPIYTESVPPIYVEAKYRNLSFELTNIINSKMNTIYSPYYANLNHILPTTPHINSFYIAPYYNTWFNNQSRAFVDLYVTPSYLATGNFHNILGTRLTDFSLIFGVSFPIENFNPIRDELVTLGVHRKNLGITPTKVYINKYSGAGSSPTRYTFYTRGTLGEHVAYLGTSHVNAQYFGSLSFTETRTLIARYNQEKNISNYNRLNIETLTPNDIVTNFVFLYFPEVEAVYNSSDSRNSTNFNLPVIYNRYFGTNNNYYYVKTEILTNVNYAINMYEVDMYNAQRNVHIKWYEQELDIGM